MTTTNPDPNSVQMVFPDINVLAECYAIPYGWPGLVSNIVVLYVFTCVLRGCSPLIPVRKLRCHNFNGVLALLQFLGCAGLIARTYFQCVGRGRLDLVLVMGSMFCAIPLTTLPLLHVARIRRGIAARQKAGDGDGARKLASTSRSDGYELLADAERGEEGRTEGLESGDADIPVNGDGDNEVDGQQPPTVPAPAEKSDAHVTHAADKSDGADGVTLLKQGGDDDDDAAATSSNENKPTTTAHPPAKKRTAIVMPLPTPLAALTSYFNVLTLAVEVMAGTYLVLQSAGVDQTSWQAKTIWVVLAGIFDMAVLFFVLALVMPIYRRFRADGWRGLRAMTFVNFLGFYHRRAGPYLWVRKTPKPWLVAAYAGMATTVLSNWVLAMAAGGNWGIPELKEGRGGLVAAYWLYFVVSMVSLLSV